MNSWELSERLRWIYQLACAAEPAKAKAYVDGAMFAVALETNEVTPEVFEYGKSTGILYGYVADDALELIRTGHSSTENLYLGKLPKGVVNLLGIDGIKASNACRLYEELGIETVEELKRASMTGLIASKHDFSQRFSDQVGYLATQALSGRRSVPLPRMVHLSKLVCEKISRHPDVKKAYTVGDVRRGKELIEKMDFLCAVSRPSDELAKDIAQKIELSDVEVTKSGVTGKFYGIDTRIHLCKPKYVGSALAWSTGPGDFYQRLESLVFKPFRTRAGFIAIIGDERSFFEKLGLPFIPPEIREWPDVIELSKNVGSWDLIQDDDILGDLHCHTTWSDGRSRVSEIIMEAERQNLEYVAITDHAECIGVTKGLTRQSLAKQIDLVGRTNSGQNQCRLISGIEYNIGDDGKVDFEMRQNILKLAGLHSGLGQHPEEITQRYLTAIKSGHIDILVHSTTRKLQHRPVLDLDWEQIFLTCAKFGVAVEMNYAPDRCDIPWNLGRLADKCGCVFSIGGDIHGASQLTNVRIGGILARRSGLSKEKVLNSFRHDYILEKKWRTI
jgi:DNA polymerase (family 10)